MGFANPSSSSEILYGVSGDVRGEINAYVNIPTGAHYADESEISGTLVINSLRKATRIINAFLEVTYSDQIPFTAVSDVPVLLDEIASDMATFYVWRSSHAIMGKVPEDKKEQYYDVYMDPKDGMLAKLANREMQIPELTAVYGDDVKAIRGGHASVFDLDSDLETRVDPTLIEEIERDRR